jgi:membrane-associated protein
VLVRLLILAAVLGDSVNYSIGHYIGPRVFEKPDSAGSSRSTCGARKASSTKIRRGYDHHRPLRSHHPTFAPFPRGRGGMQYRRFFAFNVVGGILCGPRSLSRATSSATSRG